MVLPKQRRFGVKRELIGGDSSDTDGVGLAESDEAALVWMALPVHLGTFRHYTEKFCRFSYETLNATSCRERSFP